MPAADLTKLAAVYKQMYPAGVRTIGLSGLEVVSWSEYIYRHGPEAAREHAIELGRERYAQIHAELQVAALRAMPLRAYTQAELGMVLQPLQARIAVRPLPRLTWWRRLWRWAFTFPARTPRAKALRA